MVNWKSKYLEMKLKYINLKFKGGGCSPSSEEGEEYHRNEEEIRKLINEIEQLKPAPVGDDEVIRFEVNIQDLNLQKELWAKLQTYLNKIHGFNSNQFKYWKIMVDEDKISNDTLRELVAKHQLWNSYNVQQSALLDKCTLQQRRDLTQLGGK